MNSQWEEEKNATKFKNEGNQFFNEANFLEALKTYKRGLQTWKRFLKKTGHDFEKSENHLLSVFHSNIGLCHKKLYEAGDEIHYHDDGNSINRMSRIEAAIKAYSKAVHAEPLWEKPHLSRSLVFKMLKDVFTSEEGVLDSLDAAKDRKFANIIVDQTQPCPRRKINNKMVFNDLQKALDFCKDDDQVFLEKGVYYFEKILRIDKKIKLVGVSMAAILRCAPEIPGQPVGGVCVVCVKNPVVFKRLHFQTCVAVVACFTVAIEKCLFDGDNHLALIKIDPTNTPKIELSKHVRKQVSWTGPKKKTIYTYPIYVTVSLCVFNKCSEANLYNSVICEGETGMINLTNCLFDKCHTIGVKYESIMTFNDCEIRNSSNSGVLCNNKATLNLTATTFIQENNCNATSALYCMSANGIVSKCFFQNTDTSPAFRETVTVLNINKANVTVERNLFFQNNNFKAPSGKSDFRVALSIGRKASSICKIVKNKFIDNNVALHIINGAAPIVAGNTFIGNTHKNIFVTGGAFPKIMENVFDFSDPNKAGNTLRSYGVVFKGGSGGFCAKNHFIKLVKCVLLDDSSVPILLDNIYEDTVLKNGDNNKITVIQEGFSLIDCSEEEKKVAESLKDGQDEKKEVLRLCAYCLQCKKCDLCKQCRLSYYCSSECQRKDWAKHGESCVKIDQMKNERKLPKALEWDQVLKNGISINSNKNSAS